MKRQVGGYNIGLYYGDLKQSDMEHPATGVGQAYKRPVGTRDGASAPSASVPPAAPMLCPSSGFSMEGGVPLGSPPPPPVTCHMSHVTGPGAGQVRAGHNSNHCTAG